MKAIVLSAYGDATQLESRDMPEPAVGPNQLKVRMVGAGINPVDWKLRSGDLKAMMPLHLPAILGRDASGVVVEVGPGATGFKVGDRVMGLVMGAYAEIVVADTEAWAEVPFGMNLIDAAALPLVLLTGAQLIEGSVQPHRGDVVLVIGAMGSVGRVAVFCAQALGAKVWAGVRGSQRGGAAKLGVEGVVALDEAADLAQLPPLDAIADTVGGSTIAKLLARVKPGGTIGSVVGVPSGAVEQGLVVRSMLTRPDAKRLAGLAQAVAEGRLVVPIATRLRLVQAGEGQTLAEHHHGGKVVLMGASSAKEPSQASPRRAHPTRDGKSP